MPKPSEALAIGVVIIGSVISVFIGALSLGPQTSIREEGGYRRPEPIRNSVGDAPTETVSIAAVSGGVHTARGEEIVPAHRSRNRESAITTRPVREVPDALAAARRAEEVRTGPARRYLPSDRPEYWSGDSGVWGHLSYRIKQVHYVVSHVIPDAPGVREGVRGRESPNPTGYQ